MSEETPDTREVIVIDEHHGKALLRRLRIVDPFKDKLKHRQSIATLIIPDATLKACGKAQAEREPEPRPEPPRIA